MRNRRNILIRWALATTLATLPVTTGGSGAEGEPLDSEVVSGTLLKLDLQNSRGLLRTDVGRPIYFDVPKAYLFENVVVGARISLRLDEEGRAVKVMDTSIPDVFVPPEANHAVHPLAPNEEEPLSP